MPVDEFRRGEIEIQWLERRLASLTAVIAPEESQRAAAIAAALFADRDRHAGASPGTGRQRREQAADTDAWRRLARREGLR